MKFISIFLIWLIHYATATSIRGGIYRLESSSENEFANSIEVLNINGAHYNIDDESITLKGVHPSDAKASRSNLLRKDQSMINPDQSAGIFRKLSYDFYDASPYCSQMDDPRYCSNYLEESFSSWEERAILGY
eukprot:CAMPEP_0113304960 /NCGR_PEP_ID=MMETSP0010_2-20120614/4764_1 /TAXON_ID=216773 ORGANISM="Corethron hystrix, Strain 308" /NCGR_SAMPLE_ID=MMETSP0010_2 /ASSEMBLY_ACC=CAM_ASM_000155 /LENGTH=132 /DNA_ID=CAMNT_0000159255 /DNA_START=1 /DNA_END=396 /DNA_ORIENTATION=- /assembly_acc=CAM_ASM_000155